MNFLKYILCIFPIILFSYPYLWAQADHVKLKIQVHVPETDIRDSVYISGNHAQLGNWHPDYALLDQISSRFWQKEFSFPPGTSLEFKITRGRWASEAIYTNEYSIPGNHKVIITNDTTISIRVLSWKDNSRWSSATGILHTHHDISGFGLKPRDLFVWLPPGYHTSNNEHYPVLYMHDGQNMFDFQRAAVHIEWRLDETADSLISHGLIRPLIIVGITNTSDRSREYIDSDTGRTYMKLVTEVIKPFIDRTYRTLSGPEYTATGGSSAGGLAAFMLVWEHPDVFSRAACLSPAFKIHHIDYVTNVLASPDDSHSRLFYIDNGTVDLEALLQPGINEMISALEKRGLRKDRDYFQYTAEGAIHNERDWARRTWRFLRLFFPLDDVKTDAGQK